MPGVRVVEKFGFEYSNPEGDPMEERAQGPTKPEFAAEYLMNTLLSFSTTCSHLTFSKMFQRALNCFLEFFLQTDISI